MLQFRYPTEILWVNDGWALFSCATFDAGLTLCKRRWPADDNARHLQVFVAGKWRFYSAVKQNCDEINAIMREAEARTDWPSHDRVA